MPFFEQIYFKMTRPNSKIFTLYLLIQSTHICSSKSRVAPRKEARAIHVWQTGLSGRFSKIALGSNLLNLFSA